MKLNLPKSKELGACFSSRPVAFSPIAIDRQEVDIVSHAKLLGVMISNDLKWNFNVDLVFKKAAKRLCTLVSVYHSCIGPKPEYTCEVWHHSLPEYLSDQTESV